MPLVMHATSPVRRAKAAPIVAEYAGYTPTIYAAPADVGSGDGSSEANAMDLATAMTNATAGDIVGCIPGTYIGTPSGTRWITMFKCPNSGTSGSPIVFVAKYPAAANLSNEANWSELRSDNTSVKNAVIGSGEGQDYQYFIGFYIDFIYVPPRPSNGTVVVGGATEVIGTRIEQFVFDQTEQVDSDNYNCIFIQNTDGVVVKNCVFRNSSGSGNHNVSSITTYGALNTVIENNTWTSASRGVYIKGDDQGGTRFNSATIRYNLFDVSGGAVDITTVDSVEAAGVYNNLFVGGAKGVTYENSAASLMRNAKIERNTFVNHTVQSVYAESGLSLTGCTFKDNVVALLSSSASKMGIFASAVTNLDCDYNLYYESGASVQFDLLGSPYTGLAAWASASSKDGNSDEADPQFVDSGAGNYRRTGSGDTGSSTGGIRGCYVSGSEQIGVTV
jgi:hypothetical protein